MNKLHALAATLLACAALPALAEEITFETTATTSLVVVPPGWTEAGPPRLRLYGPDGIERPVELFSRTAPSRAASSVLDVGRGPATWLLDVAAPTVAEQPGEHCSSGVELELEGARTVWDRVVADVNGKTVAEGRLFALDDERSSRLDLSWPAASGARVRLTLPATAETAPEVRAVRVHPCAGDPGVEVAIASSCRSRSGWIECLATLPTQPLEELVVDLGAEAPAGLSWRLSSAQGGHWQAHGEGRSTPVDGLLIVRSRLAPGAGIRLEASGVTKAELRGRGPGVFFPVEGTGNWRVVRESGKGAWSPSAWREIAEAAWLTLTPSTAATSQQPSGPSRGAKLEGNFSLRWPVSAPAGSVAALELPPTVQLAARADLADLRLAQSGHQVPYRREVLAAPAVALEAFAMVPEPCGTQQSCLTLDLAEGGMVLSTLEFSAAGPFERNFELRLREPDQPGRPGGERVLSRALARCPWQDPLPCRTSAPLDLSTPAQLVVAFDDGDAAPLPTVDVVLWRSRQQLVFVAPGPVDLLAGDPNLASPRYDQSELASIGMATTTATLGPSQAWHPQAPERDRLFLLLALGAAAIALLLVLRRQFAA